MQFGIYLIILLWDKQLLFRHNHLSSTYTFSIPFELQEQTHSRLAEPQSGSARFPLFLVCGRIQLRNPQDPNLGSFIFCGGKGSLLGMQTSGSLALLSWFSPWEREACFSYSWFSREMLFAIVTTSIAKSTWLATTVQGLGPEMSLH